jgi:hypothetical protein
MKKNHTIIILIVSILTTISIVCLLFFLLKIIKNKNENVSSITLTIEEKMKQKENVSIFNEKVEEMKKIEFSLNEHFVNPNQIDTFVEFLERLGSENDGEVSVNNIEIPEENPNTLNIDISIKGDFNKVMRIMTLLENTTYQVSITKVYLNKDIVQNVGKDGKLEKPQGVPSWQADVSFGVLSLN